MSENTWHRKKSDFCFGPLEKKNLKRNPPDYVSSAKKVKVLVTSGSKDVVGVDADADADVDVGVGVDGGDKLGCKKVHLIGVGSPFDSNPPLLGWPRFETPELSKFVAPTVFFHAALLVCP